METNENMNENDHRLKELGGSNFKIAEGEENIKGWDVKDAQGNKLGEVDELIFDEVSLKVRYLVLDLDDNDLDLKDRKVLIPIGMAELHDDDDDVILRNVTIQQIQSMPDYDKDNLTSDLESRNYNSLTGKTAATTGAKMYDNEHFSDENLFRNRRRDRTTAGSDTEIKDRPENHDKTGDDTTRDNITGDDKTIPVIEEQMNIGKRETERGGFRISSRIEEKPVEENIRLREEHVNVERVPVDRPATDRDLDQSRDQDIELREHAEVPIVNKEARVVEEIKINKEVTERDEAIHDTVRKTNVDIDDIPDDDKNRRNDVNDI